MKRCISSSDVQLLIIAVRHMYHLSRKDGGLSKKEPILNAAAKIAFSLDVETALPILSDEKGLHLVGIEVPDNPPDISAE